MVFKTIEQGSQRRPQLVQGRPVKSIQDAVCKPCGALATLFVWLVGLLFLLQLGSLIIRLLLLCALSGILRPDSALACRMRSCHNLTRTPRHELEAHERL